MFQWCKSKHCAYLELIIISLNEREKPRRGPGLKLFHPPSRLCLLPLAITRTRWRWWIRLAVKNARSEPFFSVDDDPDAFLRFFSLPRHVNGTRARFPLIPPLLLLSPLSAGPELLSLPAPPASQKKSPLPLLSFNGASTAIDIARRRRRRWRRFYGELPRPPRASFTLRIIPASTSFALPLDQRRLATLDRQRTARKMLK